MIHRRISVAVTSTTLVLTMTMAAPAFASGTVANNDFESDAVGTTDITSWTEFTDAVDLGVTELAGCATVDTSDYSTLRDWDASAVDNSSENVGVDPTDVKDNLATKADFLASEETPVFTVEIVDGATIPDAQDLNDDPVSLATTGKVVNLYSDMSLDDGEEPLVVGYVIHGPAIVSSEFTAGPGNTIDIERAASGATDDFHVLGYIVNTDTCEQIEVLDATGLFQEWVTTSAEVPESATYRFVFVAGSYDYSWGGAAGGILYVQEVSVGGELAETGFELGTFGGAGAALLLAGAFATAGTFVARRREN